jgi:ECF sigma factor
MAAFSRRQERIVELRQFGRLTIEEAAEVTGISEATLVREWTFAKAGSVCRPNRCSGCSPYWAVGLLDSCPRRRRRLGVRGSSPRAQQ